MKHKTERPIEEKTEKEKVHPLIEELINYHNNKFTSDLNHKKTGQTFQAKLNALQNKDNDQTHKEKIEQIEFLIKLINLRFIFQDYSQGLKKENKEAIITHSQTLLLALSITDNDIQNFEKIKMHFNKLKTNLPKFLKWNKDFWVCVKKEIFPFQDNKQLNTFLLCKQTIEDIAKKLQDPALEKEFDEENSLGWLYDHLKITPQIQQIHITNRCLQYTIALASIMQLCFNLFQHSQENITNEGLLQTTYNMITAALRETAYDISIKTILSTLTYCLSQISFYLLDKKEDTLTKIQKTLKEVQNAIEAKNLSKDELKTNIQIMKNSCREQTTQKKIVEKYPMSKLTLADYIDNLKQTQYNAFLFNLFPKSSQLLTQTRHIFKALAGEKYIENTDSDQNLLKKRS